MTTYIPPTVLYILQHSITKLKYFGKTTQDIRKYKGSGVHWTSHIKKHGKDYVVTLWVSEPYIDSIAVSEFALAFSRDNNIVESELWANQIPENGLDGWTKGKKRGPQSPEHIKNAAATRIGKTSPLKGKPSGRKGILSPLKGISSPLKGIPQGAREKVECPHCGIIGGISGMKQHHFDHCKKK